MKIIKSGYEYNIHNDGFIVLNEIPKGTYKVQYSDRKGFYLEKTEDFISARKVYGKHEQIVNKILKSYKLTERSLGVIFSGDKGIGKSLCMRMIANKIDIPIICCDFFEIGLKDFLESITQECLIIFDEFEKAFNIQQQENLLTMFDGVNQTKKMYLISVNEKHRLSRYYLNRTGRFHYHVEFKYPNSEEVRVYLEENVFKEYQNEIASVCTAANLFKFNYDILRSICFELNQGEKFNDVLDILNIDTGEREGRFDIEIIDKNGKWYNAKDVFIRLFSVNTCIEIIDNINGNDLSVFLNTFDVVVEEDTNAIIIKKGYISDYDEDGKEVKTEIVRATLSLPEIKRYIF